VHRAVHSGHWLRATARRGDLRSPDRRSYRVRD
jgi:hypothetical protein